MHSEPRATKDLDIFIRASQQNSQAIYRALTAYGAPLADLPPSTFADGQTVVQLAVAPCRINILHKIDGVTFEEAWKGRVETALEGSLPAKFISREHIREHNPF